MCVQFNGGSIHDGIWGNQTLVPGKGIVLRYSNYGCLPISEKIFSTLCHCSRSPCPPRVMQVIPLTCASAIRRSAVKHSWIVRVMRACYDGHCLPFESEPVWARDLITRVNSVPVDGKQSLI